jgi:hypothetical protein
VESAAEIRKEMEESGDGTPEDLAFLTDEHLAILRNDAQPLGEEQLGPAGQSPGTFVLSGNHWVKTTENGRPIWYWEDAPGSQCGRTRKIRHQVKTGDSVAQRGKCRQGYTWYEFTVHG